ncbi:hypothetical protein HDE_05604 [Halotydeus destructor]|nr:hypothetical protein HDE_05604 [Halotydeus destructor]
MLTMVSFATRTQRQRQQNKEQEDNNGVVDGSDQVKGLRENQSPVKLTTFTGNCSLYPGDPSLTPGLTLTQLSPSPLATPTPPPGHCHNNKAYSSSGHVAMINTSYYGQDHHHGHAHHHQHSLMGTLDKSSASKLVTVRGTLEFDDRDRQEMNI